MLANEVGSALRSRAHLCLSDGDTDELSAHVREQGQDEGVDKAAELAEVAGDLVCLECMAVLPVGKADSLLPWHTAEVDDQTEQN